MASRLRLRFNMTLLWGGVFLILGLFLFAFSVYFNKKPILEKQKLLFSEIGIASSINREGTIITTEPSINEETFQNLSFVTNNEELYPLPMNLIGIRVYLHGKREAVSVPGLFAWTRKRIDASDKLANREGRDIHMPFRDVDMGKMTDHFLGYTHSGTKIFQLILDPAVVSKGPTKAPPVTGKGTVQIMGSKGA